MGGAKLRSEKIQAKRLFKAKRTRGKSMKVFESKKTSIALKAMDSVHVRFFTRVQRMGNSNQRKSNKSENIQAPSPNSF